MLLMTHHGTILGRNGAGLLVQLDQNGSLGDAVTFDPADPDAALPGYTAELDAGQVSFWRDGRALSAISDGKSVDTDRATIGDWERFRPVTVDRSAACADYPRARDGDMVLRSFHGTVLGRDSDGRFVQLERDGSLADAVPYHPEDPAIGLPGYERGSDGTLVWFSRDGLALCAVPDWQTIETNRHVIGDWEKFQPVPLDRLFDFDPAFWSADALAEARAGEALPACELAICAIMKDEALNVLEWIAYHRAIVGIERFYLYDNNSSDNVRELLDPLIAAGIVVYKKWPIVPGQMSAYADFAARHGGKVRWAAFIDLDEFINLFNGRRLIEWLDAFGDVGGVALQWLMFGSSGFDERPTDLQIASFVHRLPLDAEENRHVKTIVRMENFADSWDPHCFRTQKPVVDEYGQPLSGRYSLQPILSHKEICLHHYFTRSRADWIVKLRRGRADTMGQELRPDNWFDRYAALAIEPDFRMAPYLDATRAELGRLKAMVTPA